jgi:hypothetical protein
MRKGHAVRKPSAGHSEAPARDAELRDLLDHLGRLLAQEYVALLTTAKTPGTTLDSQGTES